MPQAEDAVEVLTHCYGSGPTGSQRDYGVLLYHHVWRGHYLGGSDWSYTALLFIQTSLLSAEICSYKKIFTYAAFLSLVENSVLNFFSFGESSVVAETTWRKAVVAEGLVAGSLALRIVWNSAQRQLALIDLISSIWRWGSLGN